VNPSDEKFRRLRLSNPKIAAAITKASSQLCAFSEKDTIKRHHWHSMLQPSCAVQLAPPARDTSCRHLAIAGSWCCGGADCNGLVAGPHRCRLPGLPCQEVCQHGRREHLFICCQPSSVIACVSLLWRICSVLHLPDNAGGPLPGQRLAGDQCDHVTTFRCG
jgi:hypothetical protein